MCEQPCVYKCELTLWLIYYKHKQTIFLEIEKLPMFWVLQYKKG